VPPERLEPRNAQGQVVLRAVHELVAVAVGASLERGHDRGGFFGVRVGQELAVLDSLALQLLCARLLRAQADTGL
jgi:hypothetical protein